MRFVVAFTVLMLGLSWVYAQSTTSAAAVSATASKDQENAINVLRQQRNDQSDVVATLAVRAAALERELAEVKEKLATCKPKAEEKK